ncbi:MAG: serine/threonine-protein kinase [Gemmatimonadaceae bacterium]
MTEVLHEQLQHALGAGFAIKREIGGGGMSRVFLVEEIALKRLIVVKLLPAELAAELSTARFQREIQLAARLQHPHIIPLISTGNAAGLPYYTMPFVDGESLRDRMQRSGELTIGESIRLLREIASALAYAHDRGVIHRDIKPENILLTDGVARVADFGVAKALIESTTMGERPLTAAGVAVGTPAYMSPEQVSADPAIDQRADVYAFGVVAYEMLTGRPPFVARTTQALLAAHVIEAPEFVSKRRPSIPVDLANLVMRCLEKRQADRPQSATEIVQVLDAMQTTTPGATTAIPLLSTRNHASPLSAKRVRVLAGVIACALLAGAGVWYARGRTPAATELPPLTQRVIIAPFANMTGDHRYDQVGNIAADRLAFSIAQAGSEVVPANTVAMALRDTVIGADEQLKRLVRATRAGILVTGSMFVRGDSLQLQVQIVNSTSGHVELTLNPETGPASDPLVVIDAVGDKLRAELSRRTDMKLMPKGFRAPKYEAYKELQTGFDLFAIKGDNVGSRPHFARAIAIDSEFVQAYNLLARQYINAGDYAIADSIIKKAKNLKLTFTEMERRQLNYQQADLDGNINGMIESSRTMAARDSSALALFLYGESSLFLLKTSESIRALRQAQPTYVVIGGQALVGLQLVLERALHYEGRYAEERATLSAHSDQTAGNPSIRGGMLRAAAGMRDSVSAMALVDSMLTENLDTAPTTIGWLISGAEELLVHGDTALSRRVAARVLQQFQRSPSTFGYSRAPYDHAVLFVLNGMPDSAQALFALAENRTHRMEAAGFLAIMRARLGDKVPAKATADSLTALQKPWMYGANLYWSAAILGALGDRDAAVQLLRQATSRGRAPDTWHDATELNSLRGFEPFEQLLKPRN